MSWLVRAVPVPDGDRPVDMWVDATGCLVGDPVADAEQLPGRYVTPGLVDAHAHPAIRASAIGPLPRRGTEALDALTEWAASGVCLVRDVGSRGGLVLELDLARGMPRLQAAGRFLAPRGRYFPALLPEEVPEQRLTELALGELARGSRWVKLIADFPQITEGMPSGPAGPNYSIAAVQTMVTAVHAAGGRVAAHVTTDVVADVVRAGVDSIEHGSGLDEPTVRLMAERGTAWTPTLCAMLGLADGGPEEAQREVAEYRVRLRELLPFADRLGVPILAGTDSVGSVPREVALLAEHGLEPVAALRAATTVGYFFLGESFDVLGQPATLVTYHDDPREDPTTLASPAAILIDGIRVR